jgi:hypothetical protein
MHRPTSTRLALAGLSLVLLALVATLQGCYERVVSVRGLGGSTYNVSEPYQENSKLDDWVFGERPDPNNKIKPPASHD